MDGVDALSTETRVECHRVRTLECGRAIRLSLPGSDICRSLAGSLTEFSGTVVQQHARPRTADARSLVSHWARSLRLQ